MTNEMEETELKRVEKSMELCQAVWYIDTMAWTESNVAATTTMYKQMHQATTTKS